MNKNDIRVRFAPSPTGFMHLGNVRSALINFIFARQKEGTFILRIEDTDIKRDIKELSLKIIEDLKWLNLEYDEGPIVGGPYEPYFQSQRTEIYRRYLEKLIQENLVYRCFCTVEHLDVKRKRQLALGLPPIYNRECLNLTKEEVQENLAKKIPFIWRFKLDHEKSVKFYDLAHKEMRFEVKHFSDAPLTREDESFTFIFANFVDDHEMKISHVFRGEDHLSNTAVQVALYDAFGFKIPIYCHLPILGNKEGKKLSKRDFGFSLTDLKNDGYLPEAICNYLSIIGLSFKKEIMSLQELINSMNFENMSATGMIRYDVEKLLWINHQWIIHYDTKKLAEFCRPFIQAVYPEIDKLAENKLSELVKYIQPELKTLKQSADLLAFYFKRPVLTNELLESYGIVMYEPFLTHLIAKIKNCLGNPDEVSKIIKNDCKAHDKPIKDIFTLIRIALIGQPEGFGIKEILEILGAEESWERLSRLVINAKIAPQD